MPKSDLATPEPGHWIQGPASEQPSIALSHELVIAAGRPYASPRHPVQFRASAAAIERWRWRTNEAELDYDPGYRHSTEDAVTFARKLAASLPQDTEDVDAGSDL